MQFLKTIFPFSFRPIDTRAFIITLLIYAGIGAVAGIVIGFCSRIWLIGWLFRWIFRIIGGLVDIYVLVGVVLTILSFTRLIE